jgi:hypothetical protein
VNDIPRIRHAMIAGTKSRNPPKRSNPPFPITEPAVNLQTGQFITRHLTFNVLGVQAFSTLSSLSSLAYSFLPPIMWSYHQYRRIGQQVRKERRTSPSVENGEKPPSKPDVGKEPERPRPQEDHIFVRESGDDDPLDPRNVCDLSHYLPHLKLTQDCTVAAEITSQKHRHPLPLNFRPSMGRCRRIHGKHKSQPNLSRQQNRRKPLHSNVPLRHQLWLSFCRYSFRNRREKPNISRIDILLLTLCPRRGFDPYFWRPGCVSLFDWTVFERYACY